MADWYYYNEKDDKIGPIRGRDLKRLAQEGTITPETKVENDKGQTALAKSVTGLTFAESAPSQVEDLGEQDFERLRKDMEHLQNQQEQKQRGQQVPSAVLPSSGQNPFSAPVPAAAPVSTNPFSAPVPTAPPANPFSAPAPPVPPKNRRSFVEIVVSMMKATMDWIASTIGMVLAIALAFVVVLLIWCLLEMAVVVPRVLPMNPFMDPIVNPDPPRLWPWSSDDPVPPPPEPPEPPNGQGKEKPTGGAEPIDNPEQPLPPITLRGRVSFSDNGASLTGGTVTFVKDGRRFEGTIGRDGSYVVGTATNAPLPGRYQISIRTPLVNGQRLIDNKYDSPETSGLTAEVDHTATTFNFRVERFRRPMPPGVTDLNTAIRDSGLNNLNDFLRYGHTNLRRDLEQAQEALRRANQLPAFEVEPRRRAEAGVEASQRAITAAQNEIAGKTFFGRYAYTAQRSEAVANGGARFTMNIATGFCDRDPKANVEFPVPGVRATGGSNDSIWGRINVVVTGNTDSIRTLHNNVDNYRVEMQFTNLRYSNRSPLANVLAIKVVER